MFKNDEKEYEIEMSLISTRVPGPFSLCQRMERVASLITHSDDLENCTESRICELEELRESLTEKIDRLRLMKGKADELRGKEND